ncbi:type II toxin-antitoxin system prevent-host-death family antitoxin [Chloroflexota bacterium]
MQSIKRVPKTDLARQTRQVINAVMRGHTVVIESHGHPEVAIVDIVDFYIMRAVMGYYVHRPEIEPDAGLTEQQVEEVSEPQDRYDLVLAHYLTTSIRLEWAAELLGLAWLDLYSRCQRLNVPLDLNKAERQSALAGHQSSSAGKNIESKREED